MPDTATRDTPADGCFDRVELGTKHIASAAKNGGRCPVTEPVAKCGGRPDLKSKERTVWLTGTLSSRAKLSDDDRGRSKACRRCSNRAPTNPAAVPPFVRVNVPPRVLSSVDGARTSPTTAVQRTNGYLMIQGLQNERVWGAVIEEQTGQMTATVGEHDGAIVMPATCIAP